MDVHVLPLEVPDASYSEMPVTLQNVTYRLTMRWNYRSEVWTTDWQDASGQMLASGIPLRTGRNAISAVLPNTSLPNGAVTIYDTTGAEQDPTLNSFSTTHKLIFVYRA